MGGKSTKSTPENKIFKKDGYRTKENLTDILEKKKKINGNLFWRIKDEDGNLLGYVKAYNEKGFILKLDKNRFRDTENIHVLIYHPLIKDKFNISLSIKWRHSVNEFLDEVGTLIEPSDQNIDKLLKHFKNFYKNSIDNIDHLK